MNVVLDTNCLLVAVFPSSQYHWLWQAFRAGKYTICYTTEILYEYIEMLSKFYTPIFAETVIEELLDMPNTCPVTLHFKWNIITIDPDDNKFVDCAVNANAVIVTNDKHFNVLRSYAFPPVEFLGINEFKRLCISL